MPAVDKLPSTVESDDRPGNDLVDGLRSYSSLNVSRKHLGPYTIDMLREATGAAGVERLGALQ